jgi:hypothetical protein
LRAIPVQHRSVLSTLLSLRLYPLHVTDFVGGGFGDVIDAHTLFWTGNTSLTVLAGFILAAITVIAATAFFTTRQNL